MLFNSLSFAIFLPVVFLLHWFVFGKNARTQNFFLVVASLFFYAWWDWRCLFLIAFTALTTWASGLLIERARERRAGSIPPPPFDFLNSAKFFCGANIVVNLAVLGVFKYYDFFAREFADAFLGGNAESLLLGIVLPVGISFYTFSALSCTIDIFREKIPAPRDPVRVFAYLSFFPQLFAGPIGRASELFPQYEKTRAFDAALATDGLRQMLWGFFKKMVVADNCARAVNTVWADFDAFPGSSLAVVAVLYSIQIYGDFSGYSDMAVGCAKLFGIRLSPNFLFPYFSRSVAEFWRRWHISLNTWFRDYLYIPLGGSREGRAKTIRNTLIIFAVCGFWHGANWTFVVWGIFHGLLFVPRLLLGKKSKPATAVVAETRVFPSLRECIQILITFALVTIGWVFFRAPTLSDALAFFERILFSGTLLTSPRGIGLGVAPCVFIALMFFVEWLARRRTHALEHIPVRFAALRMVAYVCLAFVILVFQAPSGSFIYFQF